ncbi:katanin p80 WD40 repeat-containing subunit B1 homolog KTN80.4-like isoform X2 [Aristolochia californica]|uniref:katanin p80 WD40 repeat-containing subunit B1 homolog KTN80.4-like isoform X2 n=1 Tax=Aristolochia californica TaxID=171875 RepID=UPI0035E36809
MTTKRAYKLQEFVAHASNVNCLKIGKKSSRVLLTGGEDHKVNLWAIGKPNSILSLSGHTSAVESVNFDSSEVLVAAGAASGTIKLWDLEEAKLVRTLTGHRSNCISVDFHPFGEFFASGSLDTNLKIWDIRRKGCIHTYKGHTRGVNAIRFTPDGRWVVSGGEDNVIKLWDLTAGKLLHDFKCHEGQIQCIDFHPHEFLLATGSADRTVKFWDLETFELIGSAGPETSGVRSLSFNPDGRTLLCGLHESLKVFSWEPIRCHDAVDVGWSRLSDLNIHEGKLLGCSHNQSCVGVWVVDISRVEPYAIASSARSANCLSESKSSSSGILSEQTENTVKSSMGRLSVSQSAEPIIREAKATALNVPGPPQRVGLNSIPRTSSTSSTTLSSGSTCATSLKRGSITTRTQSTNLQIATKISDVIPVIVPRTSGRLEQGGVADPKKENASTARNISYTMRPRITDFQKLSSNCSNDFERTNILIQSGPPSVSKSTGSTEVTDQNFDPALDNMNQVVSLTERNLVDTGCTGMEKLRANITVELPSNYNSGTCDGKVLMPNRDPFCVEVPKGGRTHSLVENWEKREISPSSEGLTCFYNSAEGTISASSMKSSLYLRGHSPSVQREAMSAGDEDATTDLMEQHDQFVASMQSRLTKLQVVHRYWERNDFKGVVSALEKMSDDAVLADVTSIWMEKSDAVTLDTFSCLLPLLTSLLKSNTDRHTGISLEMLLKLVRIFGPVIRSTLSASLPVGIDLQAEQRLERCNLCFIELEKVKHNLPSLTRKGGLVAKFAQELNLALQEVM